MPLVACLTLTWCIGSAAHAQVDLRVPAGGSLVAELHGISSRITIAAAPRVLEIQFGRHQQGRFVPYRPGEPMLFDAPFLVRVRYDREPADDRRDMLLTWGAGESRTVPLRKTPSNGTVFESREMFLDDPRTCTGLEFCSEPEELSYEP